MSAGKKDTRVVEKTAYKESLVADPSVYTSAAARLEPLIMGLFDIPERCSPLIQRSVEAYNGHNRRTKTAYCKLIMVTFRDVPIALYFQ